MINDTHYYIDADLDRPGYYICICGTTAPTSKVTREKGRVTCGRCKHELKKEAGQQTNN